MKSRIKKYLAKLKALYFLTRAKHFIIQTENGCLARTNSLTQGALTSRLIENLEKFGFLKISKSKS